MQVGIKGNPPTNRDGPRFLPCRARQHGREVRRQFPLGNDGRETNVFGTETHYVSGSGNHARSYLHRTAENHLVQLPISCNSEKGGYFAMSPGDDVPNHGNFYARKGDWRAAGNRPGTRTPRPQATSEPDIAVRGEALDLLRSVPGGSP